MGENAEGSAKGDKKEEGEVMDTPERSKNTQIATSISKFEESPVFNFLNSLSPIKQVKSIHITQTINPLSFASIPSVFTSPHVSSLKESRFLRRYQIADPSKPEFSSDEGSNAGTSKFNADAAKQMDEKQENLEPRASDSMVAGEQSFDCSKFVVELVEGSADACADSSTLVSSVQGTCQSSSRGKEVHIAGVNQIDQNKAVVSCEWDSLISDIVFESPHDGDSQKRLSDSGTNFYATIENDIQNMQSLCVLGSSEQVGEGTEVEHLSTQPGDEKEMIDNTEACDIIVGPSMVNPGEKIDYEHLSGFYRGMRRRCLVFEMAGIRRTHVDENLGSDSSLLLQSDGNTSSNDQKTVSIKTGNNSSRRVLPGIGLHLNALAATPKDYSILNHDSSSASGRLLIGPNSSVSFQPPTTGQELLENTLPVASSNREIDTAGNSIIPMEDTSQGQAPGYMANEETGPSSPKKKRRKADPGGEGEACKRCNCKKSKCLKLYCECFAAGVYCVEPCACIDCFNKPIHEDTVLATRKQIESRNPLAFAPKVIRASDSLAEAGVRTYDDSSKTPASARHKRGCNCKKSGCLKKYCECYQSGVGCSINCRCEGCKNAFGRKDGSGVIAMEVEAEEDETDMNENSAVDRGKKAIAKTDLVQNMDPVVPATPLRAVRQSVHLPFSSKKKLPRASFPSIGSSSGFYNRQGFPTLSPPAGFEECDTVIEEMPEFLQEGSPVASIKLSSPNQKRVSPPHSAGTLSPNLRSSRKLILQSIPSFPSLSQNQ